MLGSDILDVIIGLVLIYLVLSLVCSAIKEGISSLLAWRSKTLENWIESFIEGSNFTGSIYDNDMVKEFLPERWYDKVLGFLPGIKQKGKPTSIDPRTFSLILFNTLTADSKAADTGEDAKSPSLQTYVDQKYKALDEGIKQLNNSQLKSVMTTILDSVKMETDKAEVAIEKARKAVENWFDDSMAQVSRWYRRKSRVVISVIAILICCFLNLDTIMIMKTLAADPALRESLVSAAVETAKKPLPGDTVNGAEKVAGSAASSIDLDDLRAQINQLGIPLGWMSKTPEHDDPREFPAGYTEWLQKILGLLMTIMAVSMGAPFWFNILSKLVSIRSAIKKPTGEAEEKSEAE